MSSNVSTRTRGTEDLNSYSTPASIREPGQRACGLNILLAEGDKSLAANLKNGLARSGHQVAALAHNGQDACHLCQMVKPDLALIDLDLPQMDGMQAAYVIMRNLPIPVVLMAAQMKPGFKHEALKAGVQTCVPKPLAAGLLAQALEIAHRQFHRLQVLESKAEDLRLEIKTRKLMGRASGILMQRHGISYEQAVEMLHRRAKSEDLPLSEIAQGVLTTEHLSQNH
jgi:AmiR/NasT family two-component response regulator